MISALKLCYKSFLVALKSRLAYRSDFIISLGIALIFDIVGPVILLLIYQTGAQIPGWEFEELMLLTGIYMISQGIVYSLFSGMIWNVLERIRSGSLDLLLTKPRSVVLMVLTTGFNPDALGNILAGLLVFIYAVFHVPSPEPMAWPAFLGVFTLSLLVLFSFALLMSASLFVWQGNDRIFELYGIVSNFGDFPVSVYPRFIQVLLIGVIPVSMAGFFPASILLGKSLQGLWFACGASLLFLFLSLLLWHVSLKRYSSAGG